MIVRKARFDLMFSLNQVVYLLIVLSSQVNGGCLIGYKRT